MSSENKKAAKGAALHRNQPVPPCYQESKASGGYINWGPDNQFPFHLWDLYMQCSPLQTLIHGAVDYTLGNGILNQTPFTGKNTEGDTLEDVISRCTLDLWIFGGFALQVHYNTQGTPTSLSYVDLCKCRVSETLEKVYLMDDSKTIGTNLRGTLSIPLFGTLTPEERATQGSEIFFYRGKKSKGYYPVCDYLSTVVSAETQIEINRFHYNNISHGMHSATLLNFNHAEDVSQEVKDEIETAIKRKFSGTGAAGEVMISWNTDKDHEISLSKLEDDHFDSKFNTLSKNIREELFLTFRAHPMLFGGTDHTWLTTPHMYESTFNLYNRTTIKPRQNEITRCIDQVFNWDDYAEEGTAAPHSIEFIPFSLKEESETPETSERLKKCKKP